MTASMPGAAACASEAAFSTTAACTTTQAEPSFLLRYKPATDSCDVDLNSCDNRCSL